MKQKTQAKETKKPKRKKQQVGCTGFAPMMRGGDSKYRAK